MTIRRLHAGVLDQAFLDHGPPAGPPVALLHGFPYDVHAYDAVVPLLVAAGCRVIVPFLRGYGPTRFLRPETPRSGQQGALGADLWALLQALELPPTILAGYDWGGRAGCVVAALWPERVRGLVSLGGYNIHDIPALSAPQPPETEHRHWYQYYLHTDRGVAGFAGNRGGFVRLLWRLWSPSWTFDEATIARSAASFDNPDFVDVVVHSYRHRYGLVAGDPAYAEIEHRLAARPAIPVPAVALQGADDGVAPPTAADGDRHLFTGAYRREIVPGAGHNLPQEKPEAFAAAVLSLL